MPEESKPDKSELVNLAMAQGVPSYEAWDMTIPALIKLTTKEG